MDADGGRRQYGEVQGGSAYVQQTFPGHVWLLEAGESAGATRRRLKYAAGASESCVASIAEDAGCGGGGGAARLAGRTRERTERLCDP